MLCLFLDTASRKNRVLLVKNDQIIASKVWFSNRDESQKLLPNIETLLKGADQDFTNITHIFVISGPGGFTSLRVGVTVTNTLAYSLAVPIAATDLFTFRSQSFPESDYLLVHSATRQDIFVQGVGKFSSVFPEVELQDFGEFSRSCKGALWRGELLNEHAEAHNSDLLDMSYPSEEGLVKVLQQAQWKKEAIIEPFYGRMGQVGTPK